MADKKEKIDYSKAYKQICVDNNNKILGYYEEYSYISKVRVRDLTDNSVKGYLLTSNNSIEKYYNNVYKKVKYDSWYGVYVPDGDKIGKAVGNITRVIFNSENNSFNANLDGLAGMVSTEGDDVHSDKRENRAIVQWEEGFKKYFDSKADNSKFGSDKGTQTAALSSLKEDFESASSDSNMNNFHKFFEIYNLVEEQKVEPDKNNNINFTDLKKIVYDYYIFCTGFFVLLAAMIVIMAVEKNKDEKQKEEDENRSLAGQNTAENNNDENDYDSFSKFMHDARVGRGFKLYGVTLNELGMAGDIWPVWKNSLNYRGNMPDHTGIVDGKVSLNGSKYDNIGFDERVSLNGAEMPDDMRVDGKISLNTGYGELLDSLI